MANVSRNSFNESKQYDKVILQQGQPITDYDFNETQDIQRAKLRKAIKELFGDGAIGTGYQIIGTGATNNFTVKAGTVYKNGYRVTLAADTTATALGVTITTPAGARTDIVYLDIYEVEVDSIADTNIIHPKLVSTGLEPTRRIQIKADLKVAEGGSMPSDTSTHFYIQLASLARTASAIITAGMVIDSRAVAGIGPSMDAHKTATILDHPDNSVTDTKIGNRTVNQSIATAFSNTGTLTNILSWFAKQIRAITGKTNWYDTPTITLETAGTHITNTTGNPHNVQHSQTSPSAVNTADTNTTLDKHISNALANGWEEHRNMSGNVHGMSHSHLNNIGQVAETDTSIAKDKHVSNALAKGWEEHKNTIGNAHGMNHSDLNLIGQVDIASTDATKDKHISNVLAKGWQDHIGNASIHGGQAVIDLSAHQQAGVLDHPDGSVIDAKIGNRTVDQAIVSTSSNTGTLTNILSWIAKVIKAITGKTNWFDTPATTLEATNNHFSTTTGVHGVGASTVESTAGAQSKANTAESNAKTYSDSNLNTHKNNSTLDHPDNSVTDSKIGNRTVNQAITDAYSSGGTLTQVLSWFGKVLKGIVGKTNWYDTPSTTLEAANTHYGTTTGVHGVGASTVESAAGAQTKANTAETNAKSYSDTSLSTHKTAATLDHPDNSVTDSKIGNRTVDQATATAYSNAGTITQMLSWIVKTIKAMKGTTNWYDTPAASIATINTTANNALPKAGGTMTGALIAQTNTNYTTAQVRNIIESTEVPLDTQGNNGDLWFRYL